MTRTENQTDTRTGSGAEVSRDPLDQALRDLAEALDLGDAGRDSFARGRGDRLHEFAESQARTIARRGDVDRDEGGIACGMRREAVTEEPVEVDTAKLCEAALSGLADVFAGERPESQREAFGRAFVGGRNVR